MAEPRLTTPWSLDAASGWTFESGAERATVRAPGGDASLRLSTFDPTQSTMSAGDWVEFAAHTNRLKARSVIAVRYGEFAGYRVEFAALGVWHRGWVLRAGGLPLDVSYSCPQAQTGRDDAAVEAMLASLRLESGTA